ncbi:MAG: hypothetical protein JNM70_18400 [Anaerolineae bacterium]|nr:hypothetical protein [Anaerolineae bacterium]
MRIQVIDDGVRLRASPEFNDNNIIRLLSRGTQFENAELVGDWWRVSQGYIHASMIEVLQDIPDVPVVHDEVPYRSQWDVDANNRTADCGQTCVAMLAEWRGRCVEVNDLHFQSHPNGLSTAQNLIDNFRGVNLTAETVSLPVCNAPPMPAICLVWYGGFLRENVQDKHYTGWHWLVLLERHDDYVVTHDPDYWGSWRYKGKRKQYSIEEWRAAFIPYGGGTETTSVVIR